MSYVDLVLTLQESGLLTPKRLAKAVNNDIGELQVIAREWTYHRGSDRDWQEVRKIAAEAIAEILDED